MEALPAANVSLKPSALENTEGTELNLAGAAEAGGESKLADKAVGFTGAEAVEVGLLAVLAVASCEAKSFFSRSSFCRSLRSCCPMQKCNATGFVRKP